MKIRDKKTLAKCVLIVLPLFILFPFALKGGLEKGTSISYLFNYKGLVFFATFLLFTFLHTFYLFRRNIKWASFSISAQVVYSMIVYLGLIYIVEKGFGIVYGSEIMLFTLCMILASTFSSYLFFGLAARDYYKRPRGMSVEDLLLSTSKKYFPLFLNVTVSLFLIFLCTMALGFDFFLNFSLLVICIFVLSIVLSLFFATYFYVFCLKRFG